MRLLISSLRENNPEWGAQTIRVELEVTHNFCAEQLPGVDSIHRYLKSKDFILKKAPRGVMPEAPVSKVKHSHDLWEMDAQGAEYVKGVGYIAMINIKDSKSKAYISSFPVQVKNAKTKPRIEHYLWAMRFGFEQFGLPKAIQVDRDTAFVDSKPTSPFPSLIHLYLIGLGIEIHFIKVPPPQKQAMVERSHQTMSKQALRGKTYRNWQELLTNTDRRRMIMNEHYPCRTLDKKSPLQACKQAIHSGRNYKVEQEENLLDKRLIETYLSQCIWYRKTAKNKTLSLHAKPYYVNLADSHITLKVTFDPEKEELIFCSYEGKTVQRIEVKEFAKILLKQQTTKQLMLTKKNIKCSPDFIL